MRTVQSSFEEFVRDSVDLDPEDVESARDSRDWLLKQIHLFPESETTFPMLWQEFDVHFGSFARKTKIRPLDDIDLMIGLHAQGAWYSGHVRDIDIHVREDAVGLTELREDGGDCLNSRKLINRFVSALQNVPQYEHAEIKRNLEAATLQLKSYDWEYDIVPCFFTVPDATGRTYYIIPDGAGRWKMTDPRLDRSRVETINRKHSGRVLRPLRLMKYWNRHRRIPTVGAYLMENLILDHYESAANHASDRLDLEVALCLGQVGRRIWQPVQDPKGLQGDLNTTSAEARSAISEQATADVRTASDAIDLDADGENQRAVAKWREILGEEFPKCEE